MYNKEYFFNSADDVFCKSNILINCEHLNVYNKSTRKNEIKCFKLDFLHTSKAEFSDVVLKNEALKQDYLKIKDYIGIYNEDFIVFKNYNLIDYLKTIDTSNYIKVYNNTKTIKNNTTINYNEYKFFTGFDTEYKSNLIYEARSNESEKLKIEKELLLQEKKNDKIISYQVSFMISDDLYINSIIFVELGFELNFDKVFTSTIISTLEYLFTDYKKDNDIFNTYIIAHKNIVDFTKVQGMVTPANYNPSEELPKKYADKLLVIRSCFETLKPIPVMYYNKTNRHYKNVGFVHYRDSLLLDNPQSLAYLGESLNFKKLEIGENIEHMEEFVTLEKNAFIMYACQDANIVVNFLYSMYSNALEENGTNVPLTIAGYSAKIGQDFLKQRYNLKNDIQFNSFFRGIETIKDGKMKHSFIRTSLKRHFDSMSINYYGGRNETFLHGYLKGRFYDIDGSKFYPTMAGTLPLIDFTKDPEILEQGFVTTKTLNFDKEELGYAFVNFDYSNVDEKFLTCIPIKAIRGNDDKGLIYCRKGTEVFATLDEIKSAVSMGAKVYILNGVKFHTIGTCNVEEYPFLELFKYFAEQRNKYPKKSQMNKLWKLIANSFTGKLGQGIKGKRIYDFTGDDMNEIPQSRVSSPVYITCLTALGRVIITEIMNIFIIEGWELINVVTDGFLARSPENKIFSNSDINNIVLKYVGDTRFKTLKRWLKTVEALGEKNCLEIKHEGSILLALKTRMCSLLNTENMELSQFATTGFTNPPQWSDYNINEQIEAFNDLVINRTKRFKLYNKKLVTSKDVRRGKYLVGRMVEKEISFNYDYKRKPKNVSMENGYICIKTEAWETIDAFFEEKYYRERNKDVQITNLKGDNNMDVLEKLRSYQFRNVSKKNELEDLTEKFFIALAKTKIFTIVGVGKELDYTLLYRLLKLKGIILHTDETAFKKLKLQKFIKDNLETMKYEMLELANRIFEEEKLRFSFAGAENNLIKFYEVFRPDEEIIKEREAIKEKEIKEIERLNLIQ